jgi:hypothetical protein
MLPSLKTEEEEEDVPGEGVTELGLALEFALELALEFALVLAIELKEPPKVALPLKDLA